MGPVRTPASLAGQALQALDSGDVDGAMKLTYWVGFWSGTNWIGSNHKDAIERSGKLYLHVHKKDAKVQLGIDKYQALRHDHPNGKPSRQRVDAAKFAGICERCLRNHLKALQIE